MIAQALQVMVLAGLLIFPAMVSAAVGTPGAAALLQSRPIVCGPGPDC
jgi:hypothetical protein